MPVAEITLPVTLAVLGAGFLHALWNAMLKSAAGEPLLDTALIVAGSSVVALALLPFVAFPDRAAWPFMALSAAIHFAYYVTLAGAYRRGDLSFAYPLMRGVAPLIVTLLGVVCLGERPTVTAGRALEVHLFDVDPDLYGKPLRVGWVRWIRGEEKFADLESLKRAISSDVVAARQAVSEIREDQLRWI